MHSGSEQTRSARAHAYAFCCLGTRGATMANWPFVDGSAPHSAGRRIWFAATMGGTPRLRRHKGITSAMFANVFHGAHHREQPDVALDDCARALDHCTLCGGQAIN